MAHDWEHVDDRDELEAHGFEFWSEPVRKCLNCNTYQQRVSKTAWMRVTGYLWRPLAGRCHSEYHDGSA